MLPSWERSLERAYRAHQVDCHHKDYGPSPKRLWCSPIWQSWRFKYSWPERAAAFDAEIAEQQRRDHRLAIAEMNRRQVKLAVEGQEFLAVRLKELKDNPTGAMVTPLALTKMLEC